MSIVATLPTTANTRRFLVRLPALLLVPFLTGFLFFYGLGACELYRTESLRAIVAAEFLRSGNWVVPTLYGEPLLTKPPGMYAAIALLSWPFGGVTERTARLPSALAATCTVLLFYWTFRRHLGERAGVLAAVVLPLSLMWLDKASAAEIDMLQLFWVAAAILFFLRALELHEERKSSWNWWLASLLCVAGGVLTKWTAPAFFYSTVVALLWRRGRLRLLGSREHLVSAAVGAGLCFAWAGQAIAQAGWETFHDTVSREALMRLSPSHHPKPYPWRETLAHPLVIFLASLPISLFALPALLPGFRRRLDERGRLLWQALHCWIWPSLLFWSLIPEHASRHSLPLAPGIAGLAALVWITWLREDKGGRRVWGLVGLVVFWLAVKVVYVEVVMPARVRDREPRAKGESLAAQIPEGAVLYLFRLKDEGIMFYYGRPVLRLPGPEKLPSTREPLYCILEESEWKGWTLQRRAEVLMHLRDEQGSPIVLVRVVGIERPQANNVSLRG